MPSTTAGNASLERLPRYLAYLKIRKKQGGSTISSTQIAEDMRLNAVLVRKDLAAICDAGRPKTGFPIDTLIHDLESYLGYDNTRDAFLIGAGRLGRALMGHDEFADFGLTILAAFDTAAEMVGQEVDGKPVFPIGKLPNLTRRMGVRIAILTVPKEVAQATCELAIESGIRALWNFTPEVLSVPEHIVVQNESLATSFAVLSRNLTAALDMEKKRGGTKL